MIRLMDKILHDPKDPKTMGNMVYSLLWVMQDFVHQPLFRCVFGPGLGFGLGFLT